MSRSKRGNVEGTVEETSQSGWLQHSVYQSQRYLPALDGVRGVAVALVITCHLHERIWDFLSGFVGVIIFFVLSGYLITRLALREEMVTGRLNVAAFYIRRIFRIFPLYYFVLAIYAVLIFGVHLWPEKVPFFRSALPYYLTYLQEIPYWTFSLAPDQELPFYQSWSLGIEEKFYLVWPLLMIGVAAARRDLRLAIVITAAVICVVQGIASEGRATYHLEDYGFILFGVSLALLLSRPASYDAFVRVAKVILPIAVAITLTTQFYFIPHAPWRGLTTLYALGITVLIGALVSSRSIAGGMLAAPGPVLVGKVSYAIYLIHILCLNAVERVAKPGSGVAVGVLAYVGTFFLSTAMAYALHRGLERPMMELGRRLSEGLKPALLRV